MSDTKDHEYGDDFGWKRHLREYLNYLLTRLPRAYLWIQSRRSNPNSEKTLFLTILHAGDNVVDVGAYRGWFTLLFSHLVGRQGQVHAFEPVPETYAILRRSVKTFSVYRNVTLNCVALGDTVGTITMNVPDDVYGQASLQIHADFGAWSAGRHSGVAARMSTLDAYLEHTALSSINLIKCDVEGAERLFIRGASRAIKRHTPIVHVEICHGLTKAFNYAPADIVSDLAALGYDAWFVTGDVGPAWIDPGKLFAVPPTYVNLTCFNSVVHHEAIARLKASRLGHAIA